MTGRTLAVATSTMIAAFAMSLPVAQAQGRLYDRVDVNLPYAITLGGNTLQPGNYVIRELRTNEKQRVLLIYSDNGAKYETMVNTIPAYNNLTPDDTKVTLHHFGPDYYFDKIWIAGKNYGYEFPLPSNVKERQREREGPISVAANYLPPSTQTAAAAPAAPAPAPAQTAAPAQAAPPPPPAQPEPQQQVAQNTPPPQQEAQPAPQENQPAPQESTANREETENNKKLPATSADWVMLLLGGGGLSGLGLALRRKR